MSRTYGQNSEMENLTQLMAENKLSAPHIKELFEVWEINILSIKARIKVHSAQKTELKNELEKELKIAEIFLIMLEKKLKEIHSD